jgi:6-phosphogluconolactonase (cycloisomerase 2 family)
LVQTAVAADPAGRFLFVTSADADTVTSFAVSATSGALTPLDGRSTGSGPSVVAVHPNGRFLYVANRGSMNVSQYGISPTGAMTPLDPGLATAGGEPAAFAVDPRGRFAYAGNRTTNDLTVYAIAPAGTLTAAPDVVPLAAMPTALAVDPSGTFLYAGNVLDSIVVFRIDPTTGGLTQVGGAATNGDPLALLVLPSIR